MAPRPMPRCDGRVETPGARAHLSGPKDRGVRLAIKLDARFSRIAMATFLATYLVISLFLWPAHDDYTYYSYYWTEFLNGNITPVYPIGFLAFFAHAHAVWYNFPKLIFGIAYAITSWQLNEHVLTSDAYARFSEARRSLVIPAFFLLSPFTAYQVWSGFFDPIIGLLVFNAYLVSHRRGVPRWMREIVLIVLIALMIVVKFTGIFLIVPFLMFAFKNGDERGLLTWISSKPVVKLLVLGLACAVGLAVLLVSGLASQLPVLIAPFLAHADRDYRTVYDILGVTPPFVVQVFTAWYSAAGMAIMLCAMVVVYIACQRLNVSVDALLLLPILTFLCFSKTSHAQFLMWCVHLLFAYMLKHTSDRHLVRNLLLIQPVGIYGYFMLPLGQFMFIVLIVYIFRQEARAKHAVVIISPAVA